MKAPIAQALVMDAWQQVLDNRVFRLLLGVTVVLVAPTFLIGFHSTHVEFLWGLGGSITYTDFVSILPPEFQRISDRIEEPGIALIQMLQDLIVTSFAGTMGVVLAIAATSFFMPRMLERGAADMMFSKPVPRWALLLSRYFSGLVFVAALSFLLVIGMYLGFRVTSGYNDPGFLWSSLTLVYLYSALHAFSLLVATVTRSSVAAILLTIVLFSFSGCVHGAWIGKEQYLHDDRLQAMRAAALINEGVEEPELEPESDTPAPEDLPAGDETSRTPPDVEDDIPGPWLDRIYFTLDFFHYVLPKTTDASFLIRMLKESFDLPFALEDKEGLLVLEHPLRDWKLTTPIRADLDEAPAVWVPEEGEGAPSDVVRLSRKPRSYEENGRPRRWSALAASSDLLGELRADETAIEPTRDTQRISGTQVYIVTWTMGSPEEPTLRERWYFAYRDWLFELDVTILGTPEGTAASQLLLRSFRRHLELGEEAGLELSDWYERRFQLDAPLRYNPLFSIGSTLAFTLLSLLLAAWKLSRIDF